MTSLQFLGASGTVTGSKYLLEGGGKRILVDCGLFQGGSKLRQKNWEPFPADPKSVDAVLLTHAHVDHTGFLPRFVAQGYTGPVYCSAPTKALLAILLPDAGRLQEEESRYANKAGYSRHKPALPLFTEDDANRSLKLLEEIPFDQDSPVIPGITFSFHRVGHILGAGFIRLKAGPTTILFSGDVGRRDIPILKDPETILPADYVLLETTYGDRNHGDASPKDSLERVVTETIGRRGMLLIPAFAVGRTQELLYYLLALQRDRKIPPDLPIYVDSPMAVSVVQIYCNFTSEHDLDTRALEDASICPIEGPSVRLVSSVDGSKALNQTKGPGIIISASGMLSGGRVLHHLKNRLPDPSTTVLFVGYQADETLGRAILGGAKSARIHGEDVPVRARIENIPALSAHAGADELFEWFSKIPAPPKTTYLIHGEEHARTVFGARVKSSLGWNVKLPMQDDRETLS